MSEFVCDVRITVRGPFLTSGTGPFQYGMDRAFRRDHEGRPVVPGSHIKGKLRTALEELAPFAGGRIDVVMLFGPESEEGDYEPHPGLLAFSGFSPVTRGVDTDGRMAGVDVDVAQRVGAGATTRTRTAIDVQTRTASDKTLRTSENLFQSDADVSCSGTISFHARDKTEARALAAVLETGLRWIPSLGAEKSVGYGRVLAVAVRLRKAEQIEQGIAQDYGTGDWLSLRIELVEPCLIGGVKRRKSNYVESESIIPGSTIKGALAVELNRHYGIHPAHTALLAERARDYCGMEDLVTHFDKIRVSHAFPAAKGGARPVKRPISAIKQNDEYSDTALHTADDMLIEGHAPLYFVDWKQPDDYIGAQWPERMALSRTAIDDTTRRAQEAQLFTYEYLCPSHEIEWVANVDVNGIRDKETRARVREQFAQAAGHYLHHLGKGRGGVRVQVGAEAAPSAEPSRGLIQDGIVLVTLQSDAVMLDAARVRELGIGEDMRALYADYWRDVSKADGKACLELEDFYAWQTFKGGYAYHRYLGSLEREAHSNHYRPFYLTAAGTVFRLKVRDEVKAELLVESWQKHGLPLPAWALAEYGEPGAPLWKACPYIPENGYGEIAVNLAWHWTHAVPDVADGVANAAGRSMR